MITFTKHPMLPVRAIRPAVLLLFGHALVFCAGASPARLPQENSEKTTAQGLIRKAKDCLKTFPGTQKCCIRIQAVENFYEAGGLEPAEKNQLSVEISELYKEAPACRPAPPPGQDDPALKDLIRSFYSGDYGTVEKKAAGIAGLRTSVNNALASFYVGAAFAADFYAAGESNIDIKNKKRLDAGKHFRDARTYFKEAKAKPPLDWVSKKIRALYEEK
jgi:hypothetical protein